MKKVLIALAMLMAASVASALQETPVASALRTTGTVTSSDMTARDSGSGPKDLGILVYTNVTTVTGSASLSLVVQGKTPAGAYYDVLVMTPTQGVVGTVNVLKLRPGITAAAGASASEPLPPVFRVKGMLTGTGSATYSIGLSRTN